jgi:kynureninase
VLREDLPEDRHDVVDDQVGVVALEGVQGRAGRLVRVDQIEPFLGDLGG